MLEPPPDKPKFMRRWRRHIRTAVILTALKFAVTLAITAYLITRHHSRSVEVPDAAEVDLQGTADPAE